MEIKNGKVCSQGCRGLIDGIVARVGGSVATMVVWVAFGVIGGLVLLGCAGDDKSQGADVGGDADCVVVNSPGAEACNEESSGEESAASPDEDAAVVEDVQASSVESAASSAPKTSTDDGLVYCERTMHDLAEGTRAAKFVGDSKACSDIGFTVKGDGGLIGSVLDSNLDYVKVENDPYGDRPAHMAGGSEFWLQIGDESGTPLGWMLTVGARFEFNPGGLVELYDSPSSSGASTTHTIGGSVKLLSVAFLLDVDALRAEIEMYTVLAGIGGTGGLDLEFGWNG